MFAGAPNISIAGVLARVTPDGLRFTLIAIAISGTVIVGIVAIRRQLAGGDTRTALMVNAVIILLVSPVSWDHHWVWAAPNVLLLGLASTAAPARFAALFVVTAVVFLIDPGLPASWMRWVAWGLMYCVLLTTVRPLPGLPGVEPRPGENVRTGS